MNFFFQVLGWITAGAIVIVVAALRIYNSYYSEKKQLADDDSTLQKNVRLLLKDNNEALEDKIKILTERIADYEARQADGKIQQEKNTTEIKNLRQENERFINLLTLRDKDSIEYQQAGMQAIARTEKILDVVVMTNQNVEKLYKVIAEHLKLNTEHLKLLEEKT